MHVKWGYRCHVWEQMLLMYCGKCCQPCGILFPIHETNCCHVMWDTVSHSWDKLLSHYAGYCFPFMRQIVVTPWWILFPYIVANVANHEGYCCPCIVANVANHEGYSFPSIVARVANHMLQVLPQVSHLPAMHMHNAWHTNKPQTLGLMCATEEIPVYMV